eukprot:g638.t1
MEEYFHKSLQCVLFSCVANFAAQSIKSNSINAFFLFKACVWGLVKGISNVLWYNFLNSLLVGTSVTVVLTKVALDQLVYTPFGSYFPYLLLYAVLDGRGIRGGIYDIRTRLLGLLITGWKVWPFIHFINFYFTPPNIQIYILWSVSLVMSVIIEMKMMKVDKELREKKKKIK